MIYVNSETILKIDLFSLLIYGRVIHIWDILFLTITYVGIYENANRSLFRKAFVKPYMEKCHLLSAF